MTNTTDNITVLPMATAGMEEQFHNLLRELADFNAIYETVQEKLKAREFALEQKLAAAGQQLSNQLNEIQRSLEKFASFMTEEGAARSRMAIKQAKEEAQASLQALTSSCEDIKQTMDETETRLEHTVTQTLTRVANITQSFPAAEFKQVTQESCDEIKKTSNSAIKQIANFAKQFHRKNLIMAFVLTLFMAFILGLYLNGEWPWEIHSQVLKERNAGRALLTAWPKLTPAVQQAIINAAKRNPSV
jgi:thiol:disulfide interchange protein